MGTKISRLDNIKAKYFCFEGRLNRKPFILRSMFITFVPAFFMVLFFYFFAGGFPPITTYQHENLLWLHILLHLALMIFPIIAGFSLGIRRCHDLNLSGWWLLIGFIPYLGILWSLYLMCKRGTVGKNNYGQDLLKNSVQERT